MSGLKVIASFTVLPEWLDYNGHMNDAAYALVFSRAIDAFADSLNIGPEFHARTKFTLYTLTMLIHYRLEAKLGEKLEVFAQLLDHDAKKMHLWLEMRRDNDLIALSEQLHVCVDQNLQPPRSAAFPVETAARLSALAQQQAPLPKPDLAGKGIGIRR